MLAAIDVERGYERALAAALGDDLDASTHTEAPAHWGGRRCAVASVAGGRAAVGETS